MSASLLGDALHGGVLLQQDDGLGRIVQLVAIALFLFGPVVLRILQRLIGGAKPGRSPARDPRTPRRAAPTADPAAGDVETKGRDLWRQLMELEERAEEEAEREAQAAAAPARSASSAAPAAAPAPVPTPVPTQVRRPADPLADPDVELTQRRVQPRSAPVLQPKNTVLPPTNTVAEAPRAIPGLTQVLERVPDEDTIESARNAAPLPMAALGDVAPPQLVERGSQALRRGPSREELRRVLVLSEVLAPPVSLRAAGRGGHDPLA